MFWFKEEDIGLSFLGLLGLECVWYGWIEWVGCGLLCWWGGSIVLDKNGGGGSVWFFFFSYKCDNIFKFELLLELIYFLKVNED